MVTKFYGTSTYKLLKPEENKFWAALNSERSSDYNDLLVAIRFQFIVLLRQRCFMWSKNGHTHQAIFTNDR